MRVITLKWVSNVMVFHALQHIKNYQTCQWPFRNTGRLQCSTTVAEHLATYILYKIMQIHEDGTRFHATSARWIACDSDNFDITKLYRLAL
jgi:hypothetical protein